MPVVRGLVRWTMIQWSGFEPWSEQGETGPLFSPSESSYADSFSALVDFVLPRTARTEMVAHVKDRMSIFRKGKAERHRVVNTD